MGLVLACLVALMYGIVSRFEKCVLHVHIAAAYDSSLARSLTHSLTGAAARSRRKSTPVATALAALQWPPNDEALWESRMERVP